VRTPDSAPARSRIERRRREAREQPSESYLRRRHELELAAAVMRRKGFHGMTLRDLADEVGEKRAGIYYYVAGCLTIPPTWSCSGSAAGTRTSSPACGAG
jgi:hypothetical protein